MLQELGNMAVVKSHRIIIKFYKKQCFPVFIWNKTKKEAPTGKKGSLQFLLLKLCKLFLFRRSKKTCSILWSVWVFSGFPKKIDQIIPFMRSTYVFLYASSLMCLKVNLSWKIAVQNACCVLAYLRGGYKNLIFSYYFGIDIYTALFYA